MTHGDNPDSKRIFFAPYQSEWTAHKTHFEFRILFENTPRESPRHVLDDNVFNSLEIKPPIEWSHDYDISTHISIVCVILRLIPRCGRPARAKKIAPMQRRLSK